MSDMDGKVCLVTGATNGIGKAAALELAKMGATVVVAGRNPEKTERVVNELREQSRNENVNKAIADLSSMEDVRELAAQFRERYDRLDVLVNNAGMIYPDRRTTEDGYEMTFALNHLSNFLLTNLLLDMLQASAPSRMIVVSSGAHEMTGMNFDDIQMENGYNGWTAYGQSKLANVMFAYALARRLEGTGVTANAMHPGLVSTGFGREMGVLFKLLAPLLKIFAKSPEKGADTLVYLASSPKVEGVTGKYFQDREPKRTSAASYDEDAQERLWEISAAMVGLGVGV